MRRILEWLGGSVLVYVLVVACSGAPGKAPLHVADAGNDVSSAGNGMALGGGVGAGGMSQGGSSQDSGLRDALADAITDPTPDADAAEPTGPTSFDEPCDIDIEYAPGSHIFFADHAFPGKTKAELSAIRVVLTFDEDIAKRSPTLAPPGYFSETSAQLLLRDDGTVATWCGSGTSASSFIAKTVTFVVP